MLSGEKLLLIWFLFAMLYIMCHLGVLVGKTALLFIPTFIICIDHCLSRVSETYGSRARYGFFDDGIIWLSKKVTLT